MRGLRLGLLVSLLTTFISTAHAIDPIGWSLSGSLPAQANPNQSYSFAYTFKNNLPFTMSTPLYITKNSSSGEFSVTDACSGQKLASKATCMVNVVLVATTAGAKTFGAVMEYGKNKVPLPTLNTQVTISPTPPASLVVGTVAIAFPTSILSNSTYPLEFGFTNTGNATVNNVSVVPNSTNTPGFTIGSSTCGATLSAGASCAVTGSFITSSTTGAVSEGLTLTSTAGTTPVTTSTTVNNSTGALVRNFTLVNNCSVAVSFGFNGGAIPNSPSCTTDANCPQGSHCRSSTSLCYFSNPAPVNGQYSLAANGGQNNVYITDYTDLTFIWSGGIAGRTGCPPTGACQTADCGSNGANNACPIGQGFANPATLAEMTLARSATDNYDITAINGVNVGLSMGPTANTPASTQPYFCGNPGGAVANNTQMGDCNWNLATFTPSPASTYTYVSDTTGHTCASTSPDCAGFPGTVCGISFNATNNTLPKRCGTQLGFLNANQICSFANTNFNYPNAGTNPGDQYFNCDSQLPTPPASLAPYSELGMYACATPNAAQSTLNSCYKNYGGTVTDCCGCVDWWTVAGVNVPQAATQSCGSNMSTFWTGTVEPTITWLKKACPTMYTYQYDDASSKFTCDNLSSSAKNTVNYTITFCPA